MIGALNQSRLRFKAGARADQDQNNYACAVIFRNEIPWKTQARNNRIKFDPLPGVVIDVHTNEDFVIDADGVEGARYEGDESQCALI